MCLNDEETSLICLTSIHYLHIYQNEFSVICRNGTDSEPFGQWVSLSMPKDVQFSSIAITREHSFAKNLNFRPFTRSIPTNESDIFLWLEVCRIFEIINGRWIYWSYRWSHWKPCFQTPQSVNPLLTCRMKGELVLMKNEWKKSCEDVFVHFCHKRLWWEIIFQN